MPSLLYRRAPEILFDVPGRIVSGKPVPLFIFIKDAHRFPVRLEQVVIQMDYAGGVTRVAHFPYGGMDITGPFWWDCYNIVPACQGLVRITPHCFYRSGSQLVQVTVDNYPGIPKYPFTTDTSALPYPSAEGWYHGDMHTHTFFTSDQIEFGAPIEALSLAAFSMELDWFAATDHSYDLDDSVDDYLVGDHTLPKWRDLHHKADILNGIMTVLVGEEVTCRTRDGCNCHMLAVGSERFIGGSGYSGEKGLDTKSEHTVGQAASLCSEWGGFAVASHPFEHISTAERLILNRGAWTNADLAAPGIIGMQFHNGVRDGGFKKGMRAWISMLLQGRRIVALAGSDSHGDFNRTRSVAIPFMALKESTDNTFACVRSIVKATSGARDDIVEGIRAGRVVVSEGPFVDLRVICRDTIAGPGDEVNDSSGIVRATALSNNDYGPVMSLKIIAGMYREKVERTVSEDTPSGAIFRLSAECVLAGDDVRYYRAECITTEGLLCFTNPVWVGR